MGTKFASVHIKAQRSDILLEKIKQNHLMAMKYEAIRKENISRVFLKGNRPPTLVLELLNEMKTPAFVVPDDHVVSICSEDFEYGSIQQTAQTYGSRIYDPIFYIGRYEDDVLTFGLISDGQILHCGTVGSGLDAHGLKYQKPNLKPLCDIWGVESEISNVQAAKLDVQELYHELCRMMGFDLSRAALCQAKRSDVQNMTLLTKELYLCEESVFVELNEREKAFQPLPLEVQIQKSKELHAWIEESRKNNTFTVKEFLDRYDQSLQ